MSDSSPHDPVNVVPEEDSSQPEGALTELRGLLVGPEQARLAELQERFDNPEVHARDVSRVLPEAIMLRTARDSKIAKALEPTIEDSVKASVKKNPKAFADALFPVMGPAIRKAISSTILGMIQSFNKTLEHSFSFQGLGWRLQALRTKKPFAEVVLLHTLVYQVEQVFLIHTDTGLVLQHVAAKEVTAQDPDLVSSMLTAIQDFVRDSFRSDRGETLETLRMGGERSVWIEQGPLAVIAVVIRGTPPVDYRSVLREALDAVHLKERENLELFDGDITPFAAIRSHLEDCFHSQFKKEKQRISPLLWIVLAVVVLLVGSWLFYSLRDYQRWSQYLNSLRKEPGIVVVGTEKRSGVHYLYGLRDPLSSAPADFLEEARLDPKQVVFHLESYHSTSPHFMLQRIKAILRPPEEITLTLEDGTLRVQGSASNAWITESRKRVIAIPGIERYHDDDVIDLDARDFQGIREQIEKSSLLFSVHESSIAPGQEDAVEDLVGNFKKFFHLARILGIPARIGIIGHTDSTGLDKANLELSHARAENLRSILIAQGLNEDNLTASGLGAKELLREELTESDRQYNRCITFKVMVENNPN